MMKRISLSLLAPCALLLVGCGGGAQASSSATVSSSTSSSQVTPSIEPSTDTSIEVAKVQDLDPNNYRAFFAPYFRRMAAIKTFKAVTEGASVAKVLFIDYTQTINVTLIKGEYSYLKNESHSMLVNSVHESYFHNDKTYFRDSDNGDFTLKSRAEYTEECGVYPFADAIEGYAVEGEALLSITKESAEAGHKFHLSLDPEKATANVKKQMRKFGQLDDYPALYRVDVYVTVQDDFTPMTIDVDTGYKAKKGMETDCHQQYKVTFSQINEAVEVPNLDAVRSKL